jgi:hypothetical protein
MRLYMGWIKPIEMGCIYLKPKLVPEYIFGDYMLHLFSKKE